MIQNSRTLRLLKRLVIAIVVITATCPTVRADGIDIAAWIARLPPAGGPLGLLGVVVALLALNYALNFLVIGWPASAWSATPLRGVARDLIRLTLWAQLADRVGALLAIPAVMVLEVIRRSAGEQFYVELLGAQFVLAGIAVGIVTWQFARRRWGLPKRRSWLLALMAGVLTNPAIGMLAIIYLRSNGGN